MLIKSRFRSLDVSEMFESRVSSMYHVIMQYLNSFLSCSIRNSTLSFSESFICNKN